MHLLQRTLWTAIGQFPFAVFLDEFNFGAGRHIFVSDFGNRFVALDLFVSSGALIDVLNRIEIEQKLS